LFYEHLKGIQSLRLIFFIFIKSCQYSMFYTNKMFWTRIMSDCPSVRFMSRSNLRTPLPIHFKLRIVIGIDGLTVCILYGEISNFHSRVVGLYSYTTQVIIRHRICLQTDRYGETSIPPYNFVAGGIINSIIYLFTTNIETPVCIAIWHESLPIHASSFFFYIDAL
jgi:hypothetical protein